MKRRGFLVSGAALIGAVALALSGALPASAGTLNTGGRSCNSGYYAQTWGYYNSVGTHKQFTGSWHTQYVGNAYLKVIGKLCRYTELLQRERHGKHIAVRHDGLRLTA
jgi:hypothetical protein